MNEQGEQLVVDREAVRNCLEAALREAELLTEGQSAGDELSLDDDLGVDSFHLMQIGRHLERAFDYRFSVADWVLAQQDVDLPEFRVGGLLDFIQRELTRPRPERP